MQQFFQISEGCLKCFSIFCLAPAEGILMYYHYHVINHSYMVVTYCHWWQHCLSQFMRHCDGIILCKVEYSSLHVLAHNPILNAEVTLILCFVVYFVL